MSKQWERAQEVRSDLANLAELAAKVGRWDGICEMGDANAPVLEKRQKAMRASEDYLDKLVKKYAHA